MNYYNEFDPHAAAWLRELIAAELIPAGEIDTRSITDVSPNDLKPFTQCHFFAGIAGWPLALALAGVDPAQPLWTGSCPCQPFSVAGKGLGTADERHLWPVFANLIRECRPPAVFGEQVASRAGRGWLTGVFADLEGMGYAVAGADLCAAGVGAPHIRQRLYWVADNQCVGRKMEILNGGCGNATQCERQANVVGGSRVSGGVADSTGQRHAGERVLLRPEAGRRDAGEISQAAGGGCVGGMADADCRRNLGGHTRTNIGAVSPPDGGNSDGLEHSTGDGREQRGAEPSGRGAQCGCGACGVGNTQQSRLEGYAGNGDDGHQPGREPADAPRPVAPASGAWDSFDILSCLDGKTRRIESGTFPLAHGVPGRVGLLRGYGNAIVPQVAAAFVKAVNQ